MKIARFQIRFDTPAFLGNAEQSAQWRTPPFKAQLRQWWRIAYAASQDFKPDLAAMRGAEGALFGHASDDDMAKSGKSQVRIRLGQWSPGTLTGKDWPRLARVTHPEVKVQATADLYLGYGPLPLKSRAAIQAGESTALSVAYPEQQTELIEQALILMGCFGTVGGRSRNGWGSYSLQLTEGSISGMPLPLLNWKTALQQDWPHAIGRDDQGALIWQTEAHPNWEALMKTLAEVKIDLRTQFKFSTGENARRTEERHWLSYPITRHSVAAWGGSARLPNSLRFKVCPTADGNLVGVISHLPCLPPAGFNPDRAAIEAVWQQVHRFLDAAQSLTRVSA